MQNRYAGDVGDFAKFGLLSALASIGLRLGVQWYLNGAAEGNLDGRFTDYSALEECDREIYAKLLSILKTGKRDVSALESAGILPATTRYYSRVIPVAEKPCISPAARSIQEASREQWFRAGCLALGDVDLVFLDPDNGLAGPSVKKCQKRAVKYAFEDEVTYWLKQGQSVVLYQHQRRQRLDRQILEQSTQFQKLGFASYPVAFHRLSVRIFFILPIESHRRTIDTAIRNLLDGPWGSFGHFMCSQR